MKQYLGIYGYCILLIQTSSASQINFLCPMPQKQKVADRTYRRLQAQAQKETLKFEQRLKSDTDYSNQITGAIKDVTAYAKKYAQQQQELETTLEEYIANMYPDFSSPEYEYVFSTSKSQLDDYFQALIDERNTKRKTSTPLSPTFSNTSSLYKNVLIRAHYNKDTNPNTNPKKHKLVHYAPIYQASNVSSNT